MAELSLTSTNSISPAEAYAHCERLAREHYENFPVGSRLIPKELRRHVVAIYAFARTADDFADEGSLGVSGRLHRLDEWEQKLEEAYCGRADDPIFIALANSVREKNIPIEPLRDLLEAFRRDARGGGFDTMDDLLDYCTRSANPVGRLVLHLFGLADPRRIEHSDAICTGLQLANFWQDVGVDIERGRINIPREVMDRFGYSLEKLHDRVVDDAFRRMMVYLTERARLQFKRGRPLLGRGYTDRYFAEARPQGAKRRSSRKGEGGPDMIPHRRLRLELALTVAGGELILEKIRRQGYDVLSQRPEVTKADMMRLAWAALQTM